MDKIGVSLTRQSLLICALLAGTPALPAAPATAPATAAEAAPHLVEAFQKGPITLTAQVTRKLGGTDTVLPLFQVPVLAFGDKLDLAFSGEAFDRRVTSADWSLVVVFLPRTIAPTEQGVVDYPLKRKGDRMVIPTLSVPYDSIPMIFLIPDQNARKKVLRDLNDHLEAFRTLCAKIAAISTERAAADKFIQDLEAIDKDLSGPQYDNALQGFLHAYGDQMSADLQGFIASPSSNLDKCNFLAQEFRTTNLLVPGSAPLEATTSQMTVTPGASAASAYVSIFFELAAIINNLWPGHQFQYLPAVARDFHDTSADLYYSAWIRTTGDTRGALMCCPGNWEDQQPPQFDLELVPGESLLNRQALLKVRPRGERSPFALFGHDWKLLLSGPDGAGLPPLPLAVSPNQQSFVAAPGPILDAIHQLGAARVRARIVGRWGFSSIAMAPEAFPIGCDPAWNPSPVELAAFQVGRDCSLTLPAAWASTVDRVRFRPAAPGAAPLPATLKPGKDGARVATFSPGPADSGPGSLELFIPGAAQPSAVRPMTLAEATPELTGLEARQGEAMLVLRGRHLETVQAVEVGDRRFLPAGHEPPEAAARSFRATDGKPLDGPVGRSLAVALITRRGPLPEKGPVVLLGARPHLGEVQLTPETRPAGLAITAPTPIANLGGPWQVSLLAGQGYRFPADPTFHLAVRNADEPAEVRTLPPAKVRILGRSQKATFTLNPSELLGGRAAGKLELQIQDDRSGTSEWVPLPATFLDLPSIGAIRRQGPGLRLSGQSLDQIESVAASPAGPWSKTTVTIENGHEVAQLDLPLAGDTCYLRLFGWSDLVLSVKVPAARAEAKGEAKPDTQPEAKPDAQPETGPAD